MSEDAYKRLSLDDFDAKVRTFTTGPFHFLVRPTTDHVAEVSSSLLGAKVLSCSDDFFASKDNLIKPIVRPTILRDI